MPADLAKAAEVRALRTVNKRLARELDILKKSHHHLLAASDAMSTLHFIDQQRTFCPVQHFCQVLGAVPSRYYAWRHRQAAQAVGPVGPVRETETVAVFDDHKRR